MSWKHAALVIFIAALSCAALIAQAWFIGIGLAVGAFALCFLPVGES